MKKLLIISIIFILTISMLAILISCDKNNISAQVEIPIKEYEGTPVSKIVFRSTSGWGVKTTKVLSFDALNIEETIYNPNKENPQGPTNEVATFLEEDKKYMVDRFYTYGLFDLKEEYNDNEPVCDGGSWCLTIYFEDGTIKESKGGVLYPQEVFSNSAIAIYDKTHYQYWAVPREYVEPPRVEIEQISHFTDGFNQKSTGTSSYTLYKYKWHTTELDSGDLFEFAASLNRAQFKYKGEGASNYILLRTINSYANSSKYQEKFLRCVVKEYDDTPELTNEKVLLDCGWIDGRNDKKVDIQENKIYTVELTFTNNQYSIQVFRT